MPGIATLVNAHAFLGSVLPRSIQSIYNTIDDWVVAEAAGEILGCVSLVTYYSGLVEVRSLAVQDSCQGLGIASRLLEALIAEAERRRIPTLFALTRKIAFFGRFGFQISERARFPEKVWHDCQACPLLDNCDETAMVRHLSAAGNQE